MYSNQPGRGRPPRKSSQSYRSHSTDGRSTGPSRLYSQHFQRRRFSVSSDTPDMCLAKWQSEQNVFSDYAVRENPALNLPRHGLHNLLNWTNATGHRRRKSMLLDMLPKDTQLQTRSKLPLTFPSPAYARRKSRSEHEHLVPKTNSVANNTDASSSFDHNQELHWIEQWTPPPLSPTDELVKYGHSLYTSEETSENDSYSDVSQVANLEAVQNGFASTPKNDNSTEAIGDDDIGTQGNTVLTLVELNDLKKSPPPAVSASQHNGSPTLASSSGNVDMNANAKKVSDQSSTKGPSDALCENDQIQHQPENESPMLDAPAPQSPAEPTADNGPVESTVGSNDVEMEEATLPLDSSDVNHDIREQDSTTMSMEAASASPFTDYGVAHDVENPVEIQDELDFPHTPLNSIKEEEVVPEVPIWADTDKMNEHPTEFQKAVAYLKENGIPFDSSLPLLHNVILYFSDTSTAKSKNANSYSSTIRPMFMCETVWQFSSRWRKFKERFSAPSQMMPNQNLYFFRQGVEPMWEDPINTKGGRMTLSPTKMALDEIWEVVLSAFVGGTCHNSVVGVVMSRRGRGDRIEIWMDEQGREASDEVK
jgi:Eukaryotic initiation factor 4E